ncbi:HD-GYP domain-containing protein [Balneatrix alpica]|uniref:HD-GYP domain-containing protein n=1 Tax=Balneatrix alpica TaxID=75684 RepID=UPI00273A2CF4|nr:HD domain-containing phosphohydrolase [Balneatrix alpica]
MASTHHAFALTTEWSKALKQVYTCLERQQYSRFRTDLLNLAVTLQHHAELHPDVLLGAMQADKDMPEILARPLHCAILCELTCRRLKWPLFKRLELVAAALTYDLGFHDLLERLLQQSKPLTEEQWQQVRAHPGKGHALLVAAGIHDAGWLDAVLQHHERLDGSGYPDGLAGDKISEGARILGLADIYTAMIRPRGYRRQKLALEALRDLFQAEALGMDPKLVKVFIKELGLFPPGSLVRLSNEEVAMVYARSKRGPLPRVAAVMSDKGDYYPTPVERALSDELSITTMLGPQHYKSLKASLSSYWLRQGMI